MRLFGKINLVCTAMTVLAATVFGAKAIDGLDNNTAPASTFNGAKAFSTPNSLMTDEHSRAFYFGKRLFKTTWVEAPDSLASFDGLGPMFNGQSCDSCHADNGRGRPPLAQGETMESMLIRLSVPDGKGGAMAHPVYGDQLSEQANPGIPAEGMTKISRQIDQGNLW